MDGLNVMEVTTAPGVTTSDTRNARDGMQEHLIGSLLRLAHELYGQVDEVGERFCL